MMLAIYSADAVQRFHEKLRKFIKREQQENRNPNQIPVRVSNLGTTVTFRGPRSAVESLAAKCRAFIEQEKEDEKERGFTLEFPFPQKFANHLIGKGGSNIRDLREKFDVDIQVQDGKVELKGPKAKAEVAKAHILSLGRQLEDETTFHLKVEPKFHRELIGAQGAQINRLQTRYKVLIFFPRTGKAGKDDESVAEASDAGKPRRQQAPDEVIIRGPKRGAEGARDELLSLLQYLKDNSYTATVSVQQKQLPSLIGSGGAVLDQLRQATGAKIDIPSARDTEDGQIEIQIKGGKQQVEAAKKALEEKKAIFEDTVVKTIEVDKKYHKTLIGAGGEYRLNYMLGGQAPLLLTLPQVPIFVTSSSRLEDLTTDASSLAPFSSPSRTLTATPSKSRAALMLLTKSLLRFRLMSPSAKIRSLRSSMFLRRSTGP